MAFITEHDSFVKTSLSDLQGSWSNLREAVVENFGFPDSDKLLFQIDEAMSWESVRNLEVMKNTYIIVKNIVAQAKMPDEVIEHVEDVGDCLDVVLNEIEEGIIK